MPPLTCSNSAGVISSISSSSVIFSTPRLFAYSLHARFYDHASAFGLLGAGLSRLSGQLARSRASPLIRILSVADS